MFDRTGKIYIISSPNTEKVFIGSTTIPMLCQILATTNYMARNGYTNSTAQEIASYGGATIKLLEELEDDDKEKIAERKNYWIDLYGDKVINKRHMFINEAERKKSLNARARRYYYDPEKYQKNKEARLQHYEQNKEKHKEYAISYYHKNKDKINAYARSIREKRTICPLCKGLCYTDLEKHQQSRKCLLKRQGLGLGSPKDMKTLFPTGRVIIKGKGLLRDTSQEIHNTKMSLGGETPTTNQIVSSSSSPRDLEEQEEVEVSPQPQRSSSC